MRKILFCLVLLGALFPGKSFADNRIYFELEERVVGVGQPFLVSVNIDSEDLINALSVKIKLPSNLEMVDFIDADSVVNYWIERPSLGESELNFSGLIPGGLKGEGARVAVLSLKANSPAVSVLGFERNGTTFFTHSPLGEKANFKLIPADFEIVVGKENFGVLGPDVFPPESFAPEVARFPGEFDPWHVFFYTQDKDSGIDYYEVAESAREESDYSNLTWRRSAGPELLMDQDLRSYIYIRAVDNSGMERVVTVLPVNRSSWFVYSIQYIIGIAILLVGYWLFGKDVKKFYKK